MKLKELEDKKILILGFGKEGRETLSSLRELFPQKVFCIADQSEIIKSPDENTKLILGKDYLNSLDEYDLIIKSPGIKFFPQILAVREEVTSATRLFFQNLDESNRVIGVTGSKGKSTITSLIYNVLKDAGIKTEIVGNIGRPSLSFVHLKDTVFVYELSSYQLEDFAEKVDVAVFSAFFPDHLDYHGNFKKYFDAKANIVKAQNSKCFFVYNKKYDQIGSLVTPAQKIVCGNEDYLWHDGKNIYLKEKIIAKTDSFKLIGNHNFDNVLLVLAVAEVFGIDVKSAIKSIAKFKGLSHRLEYVGNFNDIVFYDDAISTTPESTIAAIEVFGKKIGSIILGGTNRGYDFSKLASRLAYYEIGSVVLFPDSGEAIESEIKKQSNYAPEILKTSSMKEAVNFCYNKTNKNEVCLLSTASPSYSLFKNFEEKGDIFKKIVKALSNEKE